MCTRAVHVEIVTSLDLNNFLLVFSQFTYLRRAVDIVYSDSGSTFCAAAEQLPLFISSTELQYSSANEHLAPPVKGESWKSVVKLIKNSLGRVLEEVRRMTPLIELQTFVCDAVRTVNDRPLTALSSAPNHLSTLTPACFLGQQLAPNTSVRVFHDTTDLRQDYVHNTTVQQLVKSGCVGLRVICPPYKVEVNGG